MNIFGSIVSKIFGHNSAPAQAAQPVPPPPAQVSQGSAVPQADVNSILSGLAAKNSQKLNWQTSIVDLLKLLGLDSSLSSRQQLAKELGYTGDMSDSAKMNVWLSSEVMSKLAMNGGRVPADLKH
jgi:hypothetical protein